MRAAFKFTVLLLMVTMLAGCWRSQISLYASDTPLTPFKSGPVKVIGTDGKVTHESLTLQDKTYRLGAVGSDGTFTIRFFPLPAATANIYVFEVAFLPICRAGTCDNAKADASRYYGLARVTDAGVEELMAGDCDAQTAKRLGAVGIDSMNNCEFSDRATLENALLTLIGTKPVSVNSQE